MFEKFTDRALVAIMRAQQEAARHGHARIETVHLLISFSGNNEVGQTMRNCGITPTEARRVAEQIIGRGTDSDLSDPSFSSGLKLVFENATAAAKNLGSDEVHPKHLLLALLSNRDKALLMALDALNVSVPTLEKAVNELPIELPPPFDYFNAIKSNRIRQVSLFTDQLEVWKNLADKATLDGNPDAVAKIEIERARLQRTFEFFRSLDEPLYE